MTVDFRCEKCGKLLSVDATEGSSVRCPHCNRKMQVPAGLASLPRPHVPPGTSAATAEPPVQGQSPGQDHEIMVPAQADPMMTLMAAMMPWVLSIFLHVGVGLIMLFVVMISYKTLPTVVTRPDNPAEEDVPNMMAVGDRPSLNDLTRRTKRKNLYAQRETAVQANAGRTDKHVKLVGAGARSGSGDVFGRAKTGGGGPGLFGTENPPRKSNHVVNHVVYVIDRSGSMVTRFDEVRMEMLLSISRLRKEQDFHVILFAESKTVENPPRKLVYANTANTQGAVRFLESDKVRPSGNTTALPALKRAFEVLKAADPTRKGQVIYLLTDGQFSGIGGGSRYKGLSGNEAIIQWLRDNNRDKKVHILTYLYGEDPEAIKAMQQIADENGGKFKRITEGD